MVGKEEQATSMYVPLMIGTEVSHNSGIPASVDNLASDVQADGNGNMSPALFVLEPRSASHFGMINLSPNSRDLVPVPETTAE